MTRPAVAANRNGKPHPDVHPTTRELDRIYTRAAQIALSGDLDSPSCRELSALVQLLPDLATHPKSELFWPAANVALKALEAKPPKREVAHDIRKDLAYRTFLYRRWPARVSRASARAVTDLMREAPAMWMVVGMLTVILVISAFIAGFGSLIDNAFSGVHVSDVDKTQIILAVSLGALGSLVSMLSRMSDYRALRELKPGILFSIGFARPIIGIGSAFFVYLIIRSKLITIDLRRYNDTTFYMALGFLAGFSERLVPGLARKAEGIFSLGPDQDAGAEAADAPKVVAPVKPVHAPKPRPKRAAAVNGDRPKPRAKRRTGGAAPV